MTNRVDSFVHKKEKVIRYQKASLVDRAASRPPNGVIGSNLLDFDCICAILGGAPQVVVRRLVPRFAKQIGCRRAKQI